MTGGDDLASDPDDAQATATEAEPTAELSAAADRLHDRAAATPVPSVDRMAAGRQQRRRRQAARLATAAAVVLLAIGGLAWWLPGRDGERVDVVDEVTSTTLPMPDRLDLGAPVPCRAEDDASFGLTPEMTAGTVRRPQGEMQMVDTAMAASAYAATQPDQVAVGYDNAPEGSLVVAVFTGDLDRHLEELRSQVPLPDAVVVRGATATLARMQQVQAQMVADGESTDAAGRGAFVSSGPQWDGLRVQLGAGEIEWARALATQLPGALQVTVGAKRFTSDETGALRRCEHPEPIELPALPTGRSMEGNSERAGGVYTHTFDYPRSAPAGADVGATYVVRADREVTWTPDPNGPIEGVVVHAGTDEVVGAAVTRVRTLVGSSPRTAAPGDDMTFQVVAATASADDTDDPALPPGEYELVASVEIDGTAYLLPRFRFTLGDPSAFAANYCASPTCRG